MKPNEAEEHLRVIRSLMERATIYRAISAPIALIGGLLAIAGCAVELRLGHHSSPVGFFAVWLVVAALTVIANICFIWKSAEKRGEPFFSPGMKMAISCSFPAFLSAFVFTILIAFFFSGRHDAVFLAMFLFPIWSVFYGLALLSTAHFAPRSIKVLGWCFLIAGLLTPLLLLVPFLTARFLFLFYYDGNILMGVTFGLFHLIYAACTWPRKASQPDPASR